MTEFKKTTVKLVPCKFFPEFLKEGVYLITSGRNQVFRIKEKNNQNFLLENRFGEVIKLEHLNESNEMLLIFLVNSKIDHKDPDILFTTENGYVIADVFDLMGNQIKQADVIDLKPDEIGYIIRMYGDYREWKSENGFTAHQAYYWVDRIMVLDESKIREDGNYERSYVTEHTLKDFESDPRYKGWKEILNPLDFSDIEKILEKKETRIETEIIEIGDPDGKNIDLAIEHPVRRNGKGMICVDEL